MARRWEGGDPGVSNQKTPTTILLTPERKFHSFGYAARDFYHDLDPTESKHWLYFEKFKMKLHTTGVSNTQTVFAAQVVFLRTLLHFLSTRSEASLHLESKLSKLNSLVSIMIHVVSHCIWQLYLASLSCSLKVQCLLCLDLHALSGSLHEGGLFNKSGQQQWDIKARLSSRAAEQIHSEFIARTASAINLTLFLLIVVLSLIHSRALGISQYFLF